MKDGHILDRPIWNALSQMQHAYAVGDRYAKRFAGDIGPLAATVAQTRRAYESLSHFMNPHESLALFLEEPLRISAGWIQEFNGALLQMVYKGKLPRTHSSCAVVVKLGASDVHNMLELTELAKPGPFKHRTIELGAYFGIYTDGQLLAMAGERLHVPGFREVSAVCTHPKFLGRGYAKAVILEVIKHIIDNGEIPFLHCLEDNPARHLYEKMGFETRRLFHVTLVRHLD